MKQILAPTIFAALMLTGAQTFAGDSMKSDTMTSQQKHMMKDCMARKKAMNSDMSKDDMKSACMAEMKNKMNSDQVNGDHMNGDQMNNGASDSAPPKQ